MASSSREKMKKKKRLLLKEERPHFFFKIILDDSIPLHKLGIPRKFVQIYGDYLSSPVMLKVPSGGVKWRVEIVKSEGEVWLQDGWPEFAEYYSIVEGYFLVFEYEKSNCEFNVIIFDKSAAEIDYPLLSFSNGDSPERADLDQEQVPEKPIKKKIKLDPSANTLDQYSPRTGRQRINRTAMKKKALINEEKTNAVRKVTFNLQSKNPSFRIVMQPSFVSKRGVLVIPPSFARKYLNKNGDAALKVLDGRTWFVNYYSKKIFGITKTRIEHFGWNKFVQDNHLEVGDVCIFELIDHVQTTFRVAISKYSEAVNVCTLLGNSKESVIEKEKRSRERKLSFSNRREAKEAAKKYTSVNPSFQAQISSGRSSLVYVPSSFIRKLEPETKSIRLTVNNRCWPVKLIKYPEFCIGYLSAGWSAFARENSLKVGDVCTFQLINNTDQIPLISVSIIRDSGICLVTNGVGREAKPQVPKVKRKEKSPLALSSSQPRERMNLENFTKKTGKGKSKQSMRKESGAIECICLEKPSFSSTPEAAKKITSVNPFFQVVMTRSHLEGGGTVHVPHNFIKNLERVTRIAQLQVDNRLWSLKLIIYPHHPKSLFSGWAPFARANSLKVGDVCSFELIDTQNLVIKVSISRDIIHV